MTGIISALLAWIALNSPLEAPRYVTDYPFVAYMTGEDLVRMVGPEDTIGAYSHDLNVVFLPFQFDPTEVRHLSILMHELVHFMQDYNEVQFDCLNASEEQAYTLQNQWNLENGLDWQADKFTVFFISRCNPFDY